MVRQKQPPKTQPTKPTEPNEKLQAVINQIKEQENVLAALKADIRTKERLIKTMMERANDPNSQARIDRLQKQIFSRDRMIEQLNERIAIANAKLDVTNDEVLQAKDKLIQKYEKERDELKEDLDASTQRCRELEQEIRDNRLLWENTKDMMDSLEAQYQPEIESMKILVEQKDEQIQRQNADLQKLMNIINDMQTINNELNDKIANMNEEVERAKKFTFENQATISQHAEQDRLMQEYFSFNAELEQRLKETRAELDQMENIYENIKKVTDDQIQKIDWVQNTVNSAITTAQSQAPNLNQPLSSISHELSMIRTDLHNAIYSAKLQPTSEPHSPSKIQSELMHYKQRALDLQKRLLDLQVQNDSLLKRLDEFKDAFHKLQASAQSEREKFSQELDTLLKQNDELKEERNKATVLYNKKEIDATQAETSMITFMNRNQELSQQVKELEARNMMLDAKLSELKDEVYNITSSKRDKEVNYSQRKNQVKEMNLRIRALEAEMWNKDTEILTRDSYIQTLNEQLEDAKKKFASMTARR